MPGVVDRLAAAEAAAMLADNRAVLADDDTIGVGLDLVRRPTATREATEYLLLSRTQTGLPLLVDRILYHIWTLGLIRILLVWNSADGYQKYAPCETSPPGTPAVNMAVGGYKTDCHPGSPDQAEISLIG